MRPRATAALYFPRQAQILFNRNQGAYSDFLATQNTAFIDVGMGVHNGWVIHQIVAGLLVSNEYRRASALNVIMLPGNL